MPESILTIAINTVNNDGQTLTTNEVDKMTSLVRKSILSHDGYIVASSSTAGVWNNALILLVNTEQFCNVDAIRRDIAKILSAYSINNAIFSHDLAHEPVCATSNGYKVEVNTLA